MLNIYKLKKNNLKKDIILNNEGDMAGETKHYPAAPKEWFNSVYTYNKNTQKSLPSADLNVIKTIKNYFNMFSKNLEKSVRTPRVRLWMRRLRTNRILVAKPEFKHTNDKVIITLYVYNRELVNYASKLKKIKNLTFLKLFNNNNKIKENFSMKMKRIKIISYYLIKNIKKQNNFLFKSLKRSPKFNYEKIAFLGFLKKILVSIRFYLRLKKIMYANKSKFNSIYILPLKRFLEKLYNKEVEFDIVSLKDYHLNSSLLTQILTIKLRNRKNRVLRVVGAALRKVKLPFLRRLQYFAEIPKKTKIQNFIIKDYLNKNYLTSLPTMDYTSIIKANKSKDGNINVNKLALIKEKGDKLNMILKYFYPNEYTMYSKGKNTFNLNFFLNKRKLENTVLDSLKNKAITGIRIEASGRLTKRLIASRAIFKMRQIGSIRNINSSYKGISSVLLRGKLTSNTQFSKSKHRTRIGAFGLKGWVTSI